MKRLLIAISFVAFGFATAILCFVMISHTPISDLTGAHGRILFRGVPIAGAKVSVADIGGTLSATTDSDGKFDVKVDSSRQFYLSMANPMKHDVTVTVDSHGSILLKIQFEKRKLGENHFDLGTIDVTPSH